MERPASPQAQSWLAIQEWADAPDTKSLSVQDASEALFCTTKPSWMGKAWERTCSFAQPSTLEKVSVCIINLLVTAPPCTDKEIYALRMLQEKIRLFNNHILLTKIPSLITNIIALWSKPLLSAGISNTGIDGRTLNRCGFHSSLKLLWATHSFRNELTSHTSPMGHCLLTLFQELDTLRDGTLPSNHSLIHEIFALVTQRPELRGLAAAHPQQQDAAEILMEIISQVKKDDSHLVTVVDRRIREELYLKEPLTIVVPSIDQDVVNRTNIFTIYLPEDFRHFNFQEAFNPGALQTKNLETHEIVLRQEGQEERRPQEEELRHITSMLKNRLLHYNTTPFLRDPPPTLFIQLARFCGRIDVEHPEQYFDAETRLGLTHDEMAAMVGAMGIPKRTDRVAVPFELKVLQETHEAASPEVLYRLKAVIVHDGIFANSGHYYVCMPSENSPLDPESGLPTRWFVHNDEQVREYDLHAILHPGQSSLSEKIEQHGYLFSYERIG